MELARLQAFVLDPVESLLHLLKLENVALSVEDAQQDVEEALGLHLLRNVSAQSPENPEP